MVGLSNTYLLKNSKTYFKTVLSYSHTNNGQVEDSLNYNFDVTPIVDEDSGITNTITASTLVNHHLNAKNYLRAGIIYTNQQFKLNVQKFDFDNGDFNTDLIQKSFNFQRTGLC